MRSKCILYVGVIVFFSSCLSNITESDVVYKNEKYFNLSDNDELDGKVSITYEGGTVITMIFNNGIPDGEWVEKNNRSIMMEGKIVQLNLSSSVFSRVSENYVHEGKLLEGEMYDKHYEFILSSNSRLDSISIINEVRKIEKEHSFIQKGKAVSKVVRKGELEEILFEIE